jgi:hypothetical protein
MSKQTIAVQIALLEAHIAEQQWTEARTIAVALMARRLNKAQTATLEAAVEILDENKPAYDMGKHIAQYRVRYQQSIAASGAKSLNKGDAVAEFLEYKTGAEVCQLADQFTPIKGGQTHFERYERLNEGQKRMNSGNKLRAAVKKGTLIVTEEGFQAA